MKKFITFIFTLTLPTVLISQEIEISEALITDRPDATESPNTVTHKSLQVETGIYYISFEENNNKFENIGYNTTLLRYGLLNNFEVRLGWNFEESRTSIAGQQGEISNTGFSPILVGMKVAIVEEKGWLPTIGLLGHVYLPYTAPKEDRPETTGVDFRFAFGHSVGEKSNISYNLGAQWGNDSPEAAYIYTLAYGYSITDSVGFYAEIYGDFPENGSANHYWDTGFTYLIKNNIQLDATVGRGFTQGQDILLSAGASFRIPK